MESTWESRDLPVLDAIVQKFDADPMNYISVGQLGELMGRSAREVFLSCRALNGPYIEMQMVMSGGDPAPHMIERITSAARTAVGQWPSGEQWADRLVRSLDAAADGEKDDERRSRLRSAAQILGGIGREVVVSFATQGINRATGL